MSGSPDLLFEFRLSHTLLHQIRIWSPFLGRTPSLFTKYLTWLPSQAKHRFSFGFGQAGFLLWLAQACTINIWQLRMWCSSAWTFCAAAGYTRPSAGSVEELLLWDSVGESVVSRGGQSSWADSRHRAWSDSILALFGPFLAVASYGKLSHSHYKWVAGGSWWSKAGEQCVWWRLGEKLHDAMAIPSVQGCWFSSTEQCDTIHSHIQIKCEHFKTNTYLFIHLFIYLFIYFCSMGTFRLSLYVDFVRVSELNTHCKEQNCA